MYNHPYNILNSEVQLSLECSRQNWSFFTFSCTKILELDLLHRDVYLCVFTATKTKL